MQTPEERLEDEIKFARARRIPEGAHTVILPLSMLDPINKVQEPHFYEFVKESMEGHGLYHPLVIHPISLADWNEELKMDKFQTPPPQDGNLLRYRVQCGCNRYFALIEMGYDAVECIVVEDLKEAQDLCHVMRIDKRWQRGTNWENLP